MLKSKKLQKHTQKQNKAKKTFLSLNNFLTAHSFLFNSTPNKIILRWQAAVGCFEIRKKQNNQKNIKNPKTQKQQRYSFYDFTLQKIVKFAFQKFIFTFSQLVK